MTAPWSPDGGIHEIPLAGAPGRLWLCGKQVVGTDVEAVLRRTQTTSVVCLVQRHEIVRHYPAYVSWLDEHAGTSALWFPIPDLSAPPVDDAGRWLGEIHHRLSAGEGVVMHCAAGRGRAGTMAVGLLLRAGLHLDEALTWVRRHRPGAGPEAGDQMALIRRLAEQQHIADGPPPQAH